MKIKNLKEGLIYGLALISGLFALLLSIGVGRDFFEPGHMELSVQMEDLSEGTLFFEDVIIIIGNLGLVILLVRSLLKRDYRKAFLASLSILVFIALALFIDYHFQSHLG